MLNWLKKRLSPVKAATTRWVELAETLEETWDNQFTALADPVAALRSIYTADEDGQRRLLAEYGDRYERQLGTEHLAVVLGMKKLEIMQKDTALPLEMMVVRTLGSTVENPVQPLYALSEEQYGAHFYTADQLADMAVSLGYVDPLSVLKLDGTWQVTDNIPYAISRLSKGLPYLTSRIAVIADLFSFTSPPDTQLIKDNCRYMKPLHIVMNGVIYIGRMTISFANEDINPAYNRHGIIHAYSMQMVKSLTQHYPGNLLVDGSWRMGRDAVYETPQLDGGWTLDGLTKVGQPLLILAGESFQTIGERKIYSSGSMIKRVDMPYTMLGRLGESLLRLDHTWKVGANAILTLAGNHSMIKRMDMNAAPDSEIVHGWASELQYPANPYKLVHTVTLNSFRRINGEWSLGSPELPARTRTLDGTWKVLFPGKVIAVDGSADNTLSGYSHMLPAQLFSHYADVAVGGTLPFSLNGAWQVGGGRRALVLSSRVIAKETNLDCPSAHSVASSWDKEVVINYPGNPTKLTRAAVLSNFRRVNGGWKVGDSILPTRLNGSWKVLFPGKAIAVGGGMAAEIASAIGAGATAESSRAMAKETLIANQPLVAAENDLTKQMPIQYPANNLQLSKQAGLTYNKKLDGLWKVGGASLALFARRLDGAWTVRMLDGVETVAGKGAAQSLSGVAIPVSVRKLSTGAARIGSTQRKLDGYWRVSAYNKLNGHWPVSPRGGTRLNAPRMSGVGFYALDGNWTLGLHPFNKLDGAWKVGANHGPITESWMKIHKTTAS